MITGELLNKIHLDEEDVNFILSKDSQYGEKILPIAQDYMRSGRGDRYDPYTQEQLIDQKAQAERFLALAEALDPTGEDKYTLQLLFWLHCVPFLQAVYQRNHIADDVLYDTLCDITYKVNECKKQRGVCGVCVPWFYLIFNFQLFAFGRLQYQTMKYERADYRFGDYTLNNGDVIYGCHIPSSGKLHPELCMDSLDRAYRFFKDQLRGDILPVGCDTWLLYPPYLEKVFAEGSNIKEFSKLFDITQTRCIGKNFSVCGSIFGKAYSGSTKDLPAKTTLQKQFIQYIDNDGDFGYGFGVLLYDGVQKKIINRKRNCV